ncbi:MAG: aminoacyl-tRNA hydrolase [Desulfobacteraceae bacterium 4572_35.1]|nr:MAG: aminoacyl-tRNA hydrolase [Desulfobacteraceae bacterium 4572_35.1]
MYLIAGLGNPGERYAKTRHNVGFMVVDELARRCGVALKKKGYQAKYGVGRCAGEEIILLQPQTFMNLSGASVASATKSLGVTPGDLVVVHDEIDLPFGIVRVKVGGGHGGHNGLRHINSSVGDSSYVRLRIGVGRPDHGGDVADYVLRPFRAEEKKDLDDVLEYAADAVEALLQHGTQYAMCEYNGRNILNP